jgi:ribosomal-protein-alanine N-acetyltransferase
MFYKELETDRLLLKNIAEEDNEFIFAQFSDKNINEYLYDAEPMVDITEADELIKFYTQPEPRGQHRWILVRKSDGLKVGTCGFHCFDIVHKRIDTGYDLKKEFWGNGYMQEAMKASIDFILMNLDIDRIDAHIYYENERSTKLAEKLGFSFYGESEVCIFRGKEYLHHIYTKYKE